MATKNIVPRATGEGKLGTSSKKWLEINTVTGSFELLKASGLQDGSGNDLIVAGDNITVNKSSSGQFEISGSAGGGGSSAADDITLGDAEVNIKTTSGNINLSGSLIVATGSLIPAEASSFDLGSTTKEWKDVYLSDNSKLYFGSDQDVYLSYNLITDPLPRRQYPFDFSVDSLLLKMGSTNSVLEPTFRVSGSSTTVGPKIAIDNAVAHDSDYFIGALTFDSINTAGKRPSYGLVAGQIEDSTDNAEIGSLSFQVKSNGYRVEALKISGAGSNLTTVNIIQHNGSTAGLKLAGNLVKATAAELNVLDGGTSATSTTVVDADRVVLNDDGTMVQVSMSDIKSYIGGGTTYSSKNIDFTAEAGYHYGVDTSSGIVTADLPSVTGSINGSIRFKIKAGTNALVLEGAGSETIDGFSSFIMTDLSQSLSVMSDGTSNWEIF